MQSRAIRRGHALHVLYIDRNSNVPKVRLVGACSFARRLVSQVRVLLRMYGLVAASLAGQLGCRILLQSQVGLVGRTWQSLSKQVLCLR